jgi:diacylglycerol kinase (ATP)
MPQKIKLIYNPQAGAKWKIFPNYLQYQTSLKDIKQHLEQSEFEVNPAPTKAPGHATQLAKEAIKEGYKIVVAAGGDGTVGEVANGLVHSDVTLGIVPLGSFMNVAKMLLIPLDIEKAIQLIKIGRTRKIDVGSVNRLSGEKLGQPYYFLESAGIGLEAQLYGKRLFKGSFKDS